MSAVAPEFEAAPPERQWTGKLEGLLDALKREAYQAVGKPAWKILPRGAVVQMRITDDMRKEVRIARKLPLESDEQRKRWEAELAVFCTHLGLEVGAGKWHQTRPDPGKAEAYLIQLRGGETEPGKALCHRCALEGERTVVAWWPAGEVEGQNCPGHALEAGTEHAQLLQRQRAESRMPAASA